MRKVLPKYMNYCRAEHFELFHGALCLIVCLFMRRNLSSPFKIRAPYQRFKRETQKLLLLIYVFSARCSSLSYIFEQCLVNFLFFFINIMQCSFFMVDRWWKMGTLLKERPGSLILNHYLNFLVMKTYLLI